MWRTVRCYDCVERLIGNLLLRDEYKFFRYFPLTQEEFERQTQQYLDAKYDEILEDDNVFSGEVRSVSDNGGVEI